MKKIINWFKSPKSDFALFIVLLILVNIVSYNFFVRVDLTEPKSYSLSKGSKSLVKNLEEPLSVRVFFDENLPAPYNSVSQYVKDILQEYKGAANKNFSVAYMDVTKPENIELARDLGFQQIQIQEVKNNEVGFKQAYMGLAITYGDNIEIINPITSSDGFEYMLTSKISKMVSMADTLSGLKNGEKITLTLYLSDILKRLGINGADQAETYIKQAFDKVNKQNMDRLEFRVMSPNASEAETLAQKYGIQVIQYQNNGEIAKAAIGLVLEKGEDFYMLPFQIQQSFFGYIISGLEDVEQSITDGLQSLLSNVTYIGYITGHEEKDFRDENQAQYLNRLISGMYQLIEIDLNSEDIPAGMNSIIINGPQFDYTEEELYKIDQFVMRGGNVMFFIDPLLENPNAQYTGGPQFTANSLNIDRLLNSYGVKRETNILLDKNCYVTSNSQYGKINLYWAPVLQKAQMPKKNTITNNLGYVIMYENGTLDISAAQSDNNIKATVLAKSSDEAWVEDSNVSLNPLMLNPPAKADLKSYDLAVLLEGKFKSAFDEAVIITQKDEEGNPIELPAGELSTNSHIASSVMPGKIFVVGSSMITTRSVIDAEGTTPISMFIMNVIDYMNGNEDLCTMRTKSLAVNVLKVKNPVAANFWKFFNQYGLVVIVIITGLGVWRSRTKRRRAINKKYNPDDTRTISK